MKHIKNYSVVRKQIIAHYEKDRKDTERRLAEARNLLERVRKGEKGLKWPDSGYEVTETDCLQQIGRLEESLRPPFRGRPVKHTILWYLQRDLDRLDAADKAPKFTGLKAKVSWNRSRMWGHNPSAECWVFGEGKPIYVAKGSDGRPIIGADGNPFVMTTHYAKGHASGCGYDKLSTAVQEGISCPTIDRLIIEHKEAWECYAVDGKTDLPYLSIGGKGVSTLQTLFRSYGEKAPIPGFKWTWEEGNGWDFVEVQRKGGGE